MQRTLRNISSGTFKLPKLRFQSRQVEPKGLPRGPEAGLRVSKEAPRGPSGSLKMPLGNPPGTLGSPESHQRRHFARKKLSRELRNRENRDFEKTLKHYGFSMRFHSFSRSGDLHFCIFL